MSRSSSNYERELRGILEGDAEALRDYARGLSPPERATLDGFERTPFLVVRAAGSFGFDLVALRSEFAFAVEVKSSSEETIRFSAASGRAAEQLRAHQRAVDRVGVVVLYAYRRLGRRGGDPWRVYVSGSPSDGGKISLLRRRLPSVETTREGNGVLRWASGQPLHEFLHYVSFLLAPREAG